jgi:hypothetical protein
MLYCLFDGNILLQIYPWEGRFEIINRRTFENKGTLVKDEKNKKLVFIMEDVLHIIN